MENLQGHYCLLTLHVQVGDGRTSLETTDLSICPGNDSSSFWAGVKVMEQYNNWLSIQVGLDQAQA